MTAVHVPLLIDGPNGNEQNYDAFINDLAQMAPKLNVVINIKSLWVHTCQYMANKFVGL